MTSLKIAGKNGRIKLSLYAAIALLAVALIVLNVYEWRLNGKEEAAKTAENPSDKCAAPQGYTEQQWKEHMSHHPDLYKECF